VKTQAAAPGPCCACATAFQAGVLTAVGVIFRGAIPAMGAVVAVYGFFAQKRWPLTTYAVKQPIALDLRRKCLRWISGSTGPYRPHEKARHLCRA
jgi:hypothetical protein